LKDLFEYVKGVIRKEFDGVIEGNTVQIHADATSVYVVKRAEKIVIDHENYALIDNVIINILRLSGGDYREIGLSKTMPGYMLGRDNDEIFNLLMIENMSEI